MCCEDFGETAAVSALVERESAMQRFLDDLEVCHVAENCWNTPSAREPEPLLALEPRSNHSEHLMFGSEQALLGDLDVNIDELVPTQATVKKTFTDGRSLLETMVTGCFNYQISSLLNATNWDEVSESKAPYIYV